MSICLSSFLSQRRIQDFNLERAGIFPQFSDEIFSRHSPAFFLKFISVGGPLCLALSPCSPSFKPTYKAVHCHEALMGPFYPRAPPYGWGILGWSALAVIWMRNNINSAITCSFAREFAVTRDWDVQLNSVSEHSKSALTIKQPYPRTASVHRRSIFEHFKYYHALTELMPSSFSFRLKYVVLMSRG